MHGILSIVTAKSGIEIAEYHKEIVIWHWVDEIFKGNIPILSNAFLTFATKVLSAPPMQPMGIILYVHKLFLQNRFPILKNRKNKRTKPLMEGV